MPIVQDSGSSGGGSTTFICTPNPSDFLAILNNIFKRVEDMEKFLSLLVGADVYANNLSELAKDLGNVINGTITLPQTGYIPGGSVPVPDGFTGTVVSGNVTTIWNNGVVSFEVTTSGGITTGGISSYLIIEPASTSLSGSGLNATADLSTILWSLGSAFGTSNLSTSRIDINDDGLYHISASFLTGVRSTNGSSWLDVSLKDSGSSNIKSVHDLFGQNASPANNTNQTLQASFSFEASAGDYIQIAFNSTSGSLFNITDSIVSIEKIR